MAQFLPLLILIGLLIFVVRLIRRFFLNLGKSDSEEVIKLKEEISELRDIIEKLTERIEDSERGSGDEYES